MGMGLIENKTNKVSGNLITKKDYTITLDEFGIIEDLPIEIGSGFLMAVSTIPDQNSPPTDGYTLQLFDSLGIDILGGAGANRLATFPQRLNSSSPYIVDGPLYPTISSGGNGAIIRIVLYFLPG